MTSITEFEHLFKLYYTRLYLYANAFVDDIDVSKDIVSDVFSNLWKGNRPVADDRIKSYLYRSVRNGCMNYLRKQSGMDRYVQYCKASLTEEDENYWDNLNPRLEEMNRIIKEMTPKMRFVLEQCYLHEKSYKEVAAMMDISTDGVKCHIVRAFSLLRQHFAVKKN